MTPARADGPAAADDCLLVHGDDGYRVDAEARRWLAAARASAVTDLDVEVIDQPARLEGLRRSLTEVPFLADRRFVLVRDPPQLMERARRGTATADELAAVLDERAPSTAVCLVAHLRVPPTSPVVVAVRRAGGGVVERMQLKGRDLRAWVDARVTDMGLRVPRPAIDHLVRVAGGDLGVIDGELAKLAAFAGGRPISLVEARRLIAGAETLEVWDVVERLMTEPHARGPAAVEALLADGVAVPYITSVVAGQLRDVLRVHELAPGPVRAQDVAGALGLPPWRAERLARWASITSGDLVEGWIRSLHHLDAEMKQGRLDDAAALRSLLLRAARQLDEAETATGRRMASSSSDRGRTAPSGRAG
ncbi:MAG TPA: DNA polymerase III subunit delta [Candidatus Dormibacteraeota bacterium]|nr:DNA polymerase III subunit delta [Candidatus Dormibacteraeota bacterium]